MLDLIVNGFLDRESISNYTLVVQAQDGGSPPNKGSYPSIYLSIYLFIYLYIYVYIYISIYLSIYLSILAQCRNWYILKPGFLG